MNTKHNTGLPGLNGGETAVAVSPHL